MPLEAKHKQIAKAICAHRGIKLKREVGSGAFKHTFEVLSSDGTARALKLYRKAGTDARTRREVDAITRCSHPGIARFELIETWRDESGEYVYSLEEFLAGDTLSAYIAHGTLSKQDIVSIAISLVDAVGHIASLDLVHRDLKPDNIMFRTNGGPPVIVDFGLVRDLSETSLTKTWAPQGPGTPYYAPPEQLNNEKTMIDWRSDQFALGVVLSICGFGQHPYYLPNCTSEQIVDRVARRESPSPDFINWAKSQRLVPLIRMIAQWPVGRFRTPEQLAAAWAPLGGK